MPVSPLKPDHNPESFYSSDYFTKSIVFHFPLPGILRKETSQSLTYHSINEKYSISARLGVINNVLIRWIDEGRKETPEDIVDYLMSFILKI